jgi:RNA polymerase sigma factor (TIGR02999 family)
MLDGYEKDVARQDTSEQDSDAIPKPMDRRSFNELTERLYTRLKPLAARIRWSPESATLSPTVLLHEAYLRLLRSEQTTAPDDEIIGRFAHVMKQIMVEAARRKRSQKRGAGGIVPLKDGDSQVLGLREEEPLPYEDVLALDAAEAELRRSDPRQAAIIERRFYLGLTVDETARLLGVSTTTVERGYREAKEFLQSRLRPPLR